MDFKTDEERKAWLEARHIEEGLDQERRYGESFCYIDPYTRKPVYQEDLNKSQVLKMAIDTLMRRKLHAVKVKKKEVD